jgi:hypothetical protein
MTPADEIAALREEVRGLRRRGRVQLALAVVVLLALAALVLEQGRRHRAEGLRAVQVEAQEYRLLDPDGNLRGLWHCPPAGPSFTLLDEQGRAAADVRLGPTGARLRLTDAAGQVLFEQP